MFPVGDQDVRGGGIPFVSYAFLSINVLVFLFQATLGRAALQAFIETWGVIPAEISSGTDLYTLLTSMFMHGGWIHLIGNMLFLWVFADNIEAVIGSPLFAVFYLAGGLAASLAHVVSAPGSTIPSLGASGAIAAVLGAYLVMFPKSRVRLLMFVGAGMRLTRTSALIFLGLWGVMQLFNGIASLGVATAQTAGVAWFAHIGGFIFGLLIGFLLEGRADRARLAS